MPDTRLAKAKNNESGTLTAQLTAGEVSSANVTPVPAHAPGVIVFEPGVAKEEHVYFKSKDAGAGTISGLVRDYTNLNGGVGQQHENGEDWETMQASEYLNNVVDALIEGYVQEPQTVARVDADTFTAATDRTSLYTVGRILRFEQDNTKIAIVASSSYNGGSGLTTVEISSGTVPIGLATVEIGIQPKAGAAQLALSPGVQTGAYVYAADAGGDDTYAITLAPVPSAYVAGMHFLFKPSTANTGACTLNVNGLGAKSIKLPNGQELPNSYILADSVVEVVYNGTYFEVLSTRGSDGWVELTDGATINIDLALGNKFRVRDMAGNRTFTLSNGVLGQVFELEIWQDGTGSRTATWWTKDSTFEEADVNAGTDVITVGKDVPTGTPIKFSSATTVPAPLVAGTKYYAIRASATTIKVATSLANAQAGTAVDISDDGTGQHTLKVLVRWPSDTEAVLSTGKNLVDTLIFQIMLPSVIKGQLAMTGN